jgi:nucleoside-diphosphate-sugar epimerase
MNTQDNQHRIQQNYHGKKILITGASGFIGTNLVSYLKCIDCQIIRLSRHTLPHLSNSQATIYDIKGDINDETLWHRLFTGHTIDFIFHLAAQTNAYSAAQHPLEDLQTNITSLLTLLEEIRHSNTHPHLVFASTATAFGLTPSHPINESYADHPITLYDINKQTAEQYLHFYTSQQWLNACSLRLPNIYGSINTSKTQGRGLINNIILQALKGHDLTLYNDGHYLRDFLYIEDVIHAFLLAGCHTKEAQGEFFLLGSGQTYTLNDAFELIKQITKKEAGIHINIKQVTPPEAASAIEFRHYLADYQKFNTLTHWTPKYTLHEGLTKLVKQLL